MPEPVILHPAVVHFAIALFLVSLLFDVIGDLIGNNKFHSAAWLNLIFAGIAAVAAVLSGLWAKSRAFIPPEARDTLNVHQLMAFFIAGVILILLFWRINAKGLLPAKGKAFYYLISLVGLGLLIIGAYHGGKLVYHYGVGVRSTVEQPKIPEKPQKNRQRPGDEFVPGKN
ncbi:MAG: DUF2231 domain-containing protein [Calditrichia bacterium]